MERPSHFLKELDTIPDIFLPTKLLLLGEEARLHCGERKYCRTFLKE